MLRYSAKLIALLTILTLQFSACHKDNSDSKPSVKFLTSTNPTVVGASVTFINQTTNATSYVWQFGDGNQSTETDATHRYNIAGIYPVTLTATGPGGTNSVTDSVVVKKDPATTKPTVKFLVSSTSTVTGATVTFTNQSSDASAYLWTFGDGDGSTYMNTTHRYDSIGTFKVTLVAMGIGGTDSTSVSVMVKSNNITILDGTGIKTMSIGSSWSAIKTKYGTDTTYERTYYSPYKIYLHEVYYDMMGILFIFASANLTLATNDVVFEILVVAPYLGTTQKGIAINSPMGNVLYYYGTPSSRSTSSDGKYQNLDYSSIGIAFIVSINSNKVEGIEIYNSSKKKAGRIIGDYSHFLPKQ